MSGAGRLLIPIALRGFMSGLAPAKKTYAGYQMDFSDLDDPDIPIDNGLFVPGNAPGAGIHLHWSLPEGFAHGQQVETSQGGKKEIRLEYPLVPNRWLVTRLWHACGANKLSVKVFAVESDALLTKRNRDNHNVGSSTRPWPQTPERPYRYLGRSYPADALPDDADVERLPLTAISPANPYFSAYYPHCRNVFGFYDDLAAEGLANASVGYMVCGWYQNAAGPEPLAQLETREELAEQLLLAFDESGAIPAQCLCHGLISGFEWRGAEVCYPTGVPDNPQPGEIEVKPVFAVGSTSQEAAAAMASEGNHTTERLLHSFLEDIAEELIGRRNADEAYSELHATGFSSLKAGTIAALAKKAGGEGPPPTAAVMLRLACLRERQRELFQGVARVSQIQRAAYELWYQHLHSDAARRNNLMTRLTKTIAGAEREAGILAAQAKELDAALAALPIGAGYELKQEADLPFYLPTEPVLLMRQLANTTGCVTGQVVNCRLGGGTVKRMTVSGVGAACVSLDGRALHGGWVGAFVPPAEWEALLNEAALLSPGFADLLVKRVFEAAGVTSPSSEQWEALRRRIRQAQQTGNGGTDIRFDGTKPEAAAVCLYSPDWHPLYLEWKCLYYPDSALQTSKPLLGGWEFAGEALRYTGSKDILNPTNAKVVSGRLLVADNADRQMKRMAAKHLPEVADLLAAPRTKSLLSQSLGGFNDQLMMRDQMNPAVLFTVDPAVQNATACIRDASPAQMNTTPLFDTGFSPVRAGFFSFERVRILDKLGRFQDVDGFDLYCPESMRAPKAPAKPHEAMLPPRLLQYTRLNARWICADRVMENVEAGFVETASPLCGFVVPNRLDNSLMAYTAGGQPIGSLTAVQTGTGIAWKSPPGQSIVHEIPTNINEELYGMLSALKAAGRRALTTLLAYINRLMFQINPGAHPYSDIELVGRPLALARLALSFERLGARESYRHLPGGKRHKSFVANVDNLPLPVRLGDENNSGDGLVGFYLNQAYDRFYGYGRPDESKYFIGTTEVRAVINPKQLPQHLTVLMDPNSKLTVASGVLPTQRISLTEELVATALQNIQTTYFAAPLIAQPDTPMVPGPYRDSKQYSLYRFGKGVGPDKEWVITPLKRKDNQAVLSQDLQQAMEGYLQISNKEET